MPNQIDLPRCTNLWAEQDKDLFNKLPIYMAKIQREYIQYYARWTKLLKPVSWQANQGHTMKGVSKVPSPVLRSQVIPNPITQAPRKDVIEVREIDEDCQLYKHDFESQLMHFLPSFADFLTDHVTFTNKDMVQKIMVFVEMFYRTAIFHGSPLVWVNGKATPLTLSPHWVSPNIALSKDVATLQALIADCNKTLMMEDLDTIATVMYTDLEADPYSGSVLGDGSNGEQLAHRYGLLCETEVWDHFKHDTYLQNNRPLSMNIVTAPFVGSLFGRYLQMFERYAIRIKADGTIPAPQTIEENPAAYNIGEPVPNPDYVNAEFGVAFVLGAESYRFVRVGPPPKDWRGMTMEEFTSLDWNGKVDMTQNLLINCQDAGGNMVQETNKRGEYLQLIASIACGIIPVKRRNCLPIIYKRARVGG